MKPYLTETALLLDQLHSSTQGLRAEDAAARLDTYGPNRLEEARPPSLFRRFTEKLMDPMTLVLLAAAVVSAVTAVYEQEPLTDVWIILGVVLLNAILGMVQEQKAEQAIAALKSMTAPTAKVLRGGTIVSTRTYTLVPGDVIRLEAGDAVPADCRILECAGLKTEEASLTGESLPAEKNADVLTGDIPLGDRRNMLYMGTTVVYGRGTAVVCATGMQTEMGKIAHALNTAAKEQTPLQKKLTALSHTLTWLVLGICAAMLIIGMLRSDGSLSEGLLDHFMMAVSLAVAAIPEGLSAVVTIVLSMGVTKMSRRSAVIRRLTAVETLGCAQVICSDKTGTLTQNRMTVVKTSGVDTALLAKAMALCSDAALNPDGSVTGEATECALVHFAAAHSLPKTRLEQEFPRVAELPFDSSRKIMTTLHRDPNGYMQFTKGAPDQILQHCTHVLTEQGVQPLTEVERIRISVENKSMADAALRVLGCGYRVHETFPPVWDSEHTESDLIFIGLSGMIDPIRPEAKHAVLRCRQAGIRPVMITGDHIDTAAAIARELGLLNAEDTAISGIALDAMNDAELDETVSRCTVYARVRPEHKVRIVESWKRRGMVTAMTGDGVNDAPALKSADIGIGMGITGTDVTKNVADMILADDNFATIVDAVEEGRRIYSNIRNAIRFLLSSNLSEVICVFTATLLGFTILKPAQILWINLITDSIPALALGMEPGAPDSMRKPPRDPQAGIFSDGVGTDIVYQGLLVALLTLIAYFTGLYRESGSLVPVTAERGITMAFLTLSTAEIFHSFNMRSHRESLFRLRTQNKWLWFGAALAFALTAAVIYLPGISAAFGLRALSLEEYLLSVVIAFTVIPLVELIKLLQRKI